MKKVICKHHNTCELKNDCYHAKPHNLKGVDLDDDNFWKHGGCTTINFDYEGDDLCNCHEKFLRKMKIENINDIQRK